MLQIRRDSEAKFRRHYHDAPVMLHAIDAGGRVVSVSNRWLEVLGYTRDEVIGRKSTDFLTDCKCAKWRPHGTPIAPQSRFCTSPEP